MFSTKFGFLSGLSNTSSEVNTKQHIKLRTQKSINELIERTGFSKKQIQTLYRKFKEDFPNGVATLQSFKTVCESLFPCK
ncbi:hypothetical protein GJ496_009360, partial [Pomphorhynchus laevis]